MVPGWFSQSANFNVEPARDNAAKSTIGRDFHVNITSFFRPWRECADAVFPPRAAE
jgi:hypothetical protein